MQTPRRYAPMGGSFAPVWVAGFTWNGWQASSGISGRLGLEYAVCEQDAYQQYRVKHQQPRTWGTAQVLW